MDKNKIIKDGNTILEWDESRACTSPDEIKAILDDVVSCAKRSIIAAEVEKAQEHKTEDTA